MVFMLHPIHRNSDVIEHSGVMMQVMSLCLVPTVRISLASLACGASVVLTSMNLSSLHLADIIRRNKVMFPFYHTLK